MGRLATKRIPCALAAGLALLTAGILVGTPPAAAAARGPAAASRAPHARTPKQPALAFTVGPGLVAAPGVAVAMAPVGLSIEYPVMAADLGPGPCPPPALAQTLLQLGSPPLSLAGASQDMTAPSGAVSAPPDSWETAILYSLPSTFWAQLHCLLESSRDPLTAGLNLKTGDLAWAEQIAAGARSAAVDGLSFSLGNEPDLYDLPNYAALDKPLPDEELAVANLYIQLATQLSPAAGGAPLVGPELALPERWRGQLPRVLAALHDQVVGVHSYPLTACTTPRAVTIPGLLSASAANAPARMAWVVADAAAVGLPAIISEANSASCGGVPGVSDTPASAVWAVRFVLSALQTGFREVRFHFSGNSYDPFVVRGDEVIERPLDSALVSLNQWLPVGASLHAVPSRRGVLARAIAQPDGAIVLILDNEGPRARAVLLRSAVHLHVQILSAALAGVQARALTPVGGRTRMTLPRESIVAVTAG